jgi:hypothetical protein
MSDETACPHDPRELAGAPIGMYHCPECGEMVLAGLPHDVTKGSMTSDEKEWQERPFTVATQVIELWECEHSQCREHGNHLLAASEVVHRAFERVRAEERTRVAAKVERWCDEWVEGAPHPVSCPSVFHRIAAAIRNLEAP